MIVGPYRPLLRQNLKRPARRWPLWWSESTKTPIFVVFLLTRRKVGYMKLKNGLYCQKNTRKSCLFSPPNTVWPAERRKTAIFADFDQKTQKLHQNKPEIGIAHQFYIEKDNAGVTPEFFLFTDPPYFYMPGLCFEGRMRICW